MRSWHIAILTIVAALLAVGCNTPIVEKQRGCGSVTVEILSGGMTRADVPGDGNIYDGGGMEDLTLIMVNPFGVIDDIESFTDLTGEEQKVKVATFSNLDIGNYTIYAYANTARSLLSEARTLLASLTIGSNFGAAERDALFTSAVPQLSDSSPLLLTATTEVSVGVGTTNASIVMLRPVVLFEVELLNRSTYAMTVTDFSTSNFNASTGYMLPHNGTLPASITYGALPSYDTYTGGENITIPAQGSRVIYSTTLYENRAASYTMSLDLTAIATSVVDHTSIANTSTKYLLKNRSTGRYLADDGSGNMVVVASTADALSPQHCMWTFSGTSSGYMVNAATANRYYRGTSASSSDSTLTFGKNNNYLRISYRSSNRITTYLHDSNGQPLYSTSSGNTSYWQLQTINDSYASVSNRQLYTVNQSSGVATAMTEQLRNQHITVRVNAYYNDTEGEFDFRVQSWVEKEENAEFN